MNETTVTITIDIAEQICLRDFDYLSDEDFKDKEAITNALHDIIADLWKTRDHLKTQTNKEVSNMQLLTKVNERFYSYFDNNTKMLFTLSHGDRGVYGSGKALYLTVTYDGAKQTIATFSTKDDGHKTYREDYMGKLWSDDDALAEADEMVCKMLGHQNSNRRETKTTDYRVCLHKIHEEDLPYIVEVANAESELEAATRAKETVARVAYWGRYEKESMETKTARLIVKSIEVKK